MGYSHNTEADFAASELARLFAGSPDLCYCSGPAPAVSASATYEPSSSPWPKADGLVVVFESGARRQHNIAVEYKRRQEGIHGLLTGLGQAHAYLHKGYSGTVLVVPRTYPTLPEPGGYLNGVLERYPDDRGIGVFSYDDPDTRSPTPFAGKLHCVRPLHVAAAVSRPATLAATPRTQWVHMREGSTTRDAFFRFLQVAKRLTTETVQHPIVLDPALVVAVQDLHPGADPVRYLSSTADDKLLSRIWREFWFEWVATPQVLTCWRRANGTYAVPGAATKIEKDDGTGLSQLFEGRSSSLKNLIVNRLNAGTVNENEARAEFVDGINKTEGGHTQGVAERAHSYREDLDSALVQLALIDPDGQPTDIGYHYMSLCERYGGANSEAAKDFIGAALIQNGRYGSFLHYIYRLSEELFSADPLAFTTQRDDASPVFDETSYGQYLRQLEERLSNDLRVLRKVGSRNRPRVRTPFQVELTLLRSYGFVSQRRYRLGVGIPIDWVKVQDAMTREL